MATLLNSESRRLYSWWWDSHISPKNSKWLQENLTEIDAKVKAMIKIINEDADSFARRAEMYYKKRPELMKLVEDFYRAYRALAERYDHATGELHLAHKTMAEVFPNQVPSMLNDDIPSSSQPSSPVNPHLVRAFFDPDRLCKESDAGSSRKGLKQLNDMFQIGEDMLRELKSAEEKLRCKDSDSEKDLSILSDESRNPQTIGKAEEEMQSLKEALTTVETEKVNILAQYKQSLEKISSMEKELHSVQNDAKELDKHASEAENEVKTLRESLLKLEGERDSSFTQYKDSSEKLASLEAKMAMAQKEMTNWRDRAVKAETECQNFKQEISVHEVEKEETLVRYEQSLENINNLERKLLLAEENAKQIYEQINQAEDEIKMLKEKISVLNKEKEDAYLQYQLCLDTISKLQNELMEAKEDIRRLNDEILSGSAKMRSAEDQCALLEETNESMKLKADELVQKIAEKDQQLFKKNAELDELMSSLQDEESRFMQVKATLNSLQSLHSRSQEEQRDLSLELKHVLQLLKDLELCKQDLELDIQHLREENTGLNDLKLASCIAERDMVHEILSLKKIKENLEAEIKKQTEQNDALELQFHQLKEEIEVLHKKYRDLLQQVESAGIDPKCVGSSIKDLQDEYSRLKEIFTVEKEEKEVLLKKFEDMEGLLEKSAILESSLSDVIIELERSKEKTKVLQESCDSLSEEKLTLVAEKSTLLSQLQMITESMQCLLEKNALMENSLSSANIELEGLRVKSKSLEDACQLLRDEKTSLQIERSNLISLLEFVGKNVENLEMRFAKFEDKCDGLEKEKECTRNQVEELRASLSAEKMNNRTRLSGLEDRIDVLKVENKCRKKDFEEQLENAVNAQVEIFILQKFIQDMEEKNYTLIAECQKHTENAKYSKKVISELESENMMQHLEMEFLLDRVDKLGRGIFQVLKALEIDNVSETEPEIFVALIPSTIKGIQRDLVESRDENQQLLIQNTVFSAVIRHLSSEGSEVATRNKVLDHELFLLNQKHVVLEHEKDQLADRKGQLDTVVAMKEREQEIMKVQLELLISKQEAVQKECDALQEKHLADVEENRCLQHRLSEAEEENHTLVEDNSAIIVEALSFSNQSEVYKSLWVQKALELERVSEELNHLREAYTVSENEARVLREKLAVKETENLHLGELTQNLEVKNQELNVFNDQLNCKILAEGERVNQKKMELSGAEERIKALQDVNTELHMTIEGLEMHSEGLDVIHGNLEGRISELNQYKEHQEKEIIALQEANENLENDLCLLNEEIEAYKIREVILSSELHERSCEFELWEAEASSFYFDFQTSVVREALYEDKVHELSGLCDDLEDVSIRRSIEIETMKDKISFLESESDGLKSHLAAYFPAIASLKNNIVSLEHNPVLQTKLHLTGASQQQVEELNVSDVNERYPSSDKEKSSSVPDGLSELQDLQSRIESIEAAVNEIEEPKCSKIAGSINVKVGDGTHMKDIPLDYVSDASSTSNRRRCSDKVDQMLELWETSEQDTDVDPSEIEKELGVDKVEESKKMRQSDNKVILERLASDSQKLERLKVSIQELKRKSEMKKRRKRYKAVEYEQVKVQLEDMEDSVVQVAGVNSELIKAIEESPSAINSTDEKISRLGLDVQRIEDMVIRMEDEKNENKEGKKGFLRIRRGVALKVRLCGCFSLR